MDCVECHFGRLVPILLKMNNEQMLLCTIVPFKDKCERIPDDVQEATIQVNFRNREIRLQDPSGNSCTVDIGTLRSIEWLSLLGAPYCKLSALLTRFKGGSLALAIRIYLLKDAIMTERQATNLCDPNFIAFESMLSSTIKESWFLIENERKRKPAHIDYFEKAYNVMSTFKVIDDLYWSFNSLLFTKEEQSIKVQSGPVALVASVTDHWRETLLDNVMNAINQVPKRTKVGPSVDSLISAPSTVLIITKEPETWLATATALGLLNATILEPDGIPVSFLELQDTIIISTPDLIAKNIVSTQNVFSTLENVMSNTILHTKPRMPQVNRFFVEKLCKKFSNMRAGVDIIQFAFQLVDNQDDVDLVSASEMLSPKSYLRNLRVFRDERNTRPKGLTMLQASKLCTAHASYLPALINLVDLINIPVPKAILRKFRVFSHVIKNGPIEERIHRTFSAKYCPVSFSDAIQRFSGRPVPIDVARDILTRHYNRLSVSLGSFLLPAADSGPQQLSSEFAQSSLLKEPKTCSICFDTLEEFSITVCGHVYCNDCCRQHFVVEWALFQAKECAACRTPLLMGDVVNVGAFSKKTPFAPALASKELSIKNFIGGLRHAHHEFYVNGRVITKAEWPKHIIVPELSSSNACDLIRDYADAGHTINVQVFSHASEASQYLQFEQCF
jgi:hypothetical protein